MTRTLWTADPRRLAHRPTIATLYVLALLGPATVDLYLPALPQIRQQLHASAALTQFTLTATTLGFAIGQLVIGNWTDAVGRRRPLLVATAVHVAASLGVAAAPTIEWILPFRFLQGAGAAGSAVVASAMLRDLFVGKRFVQMLARLSLISGLAPVAAPILGSQLLTLTDWRGLFVIVAVYGAVALALATASAAETLPPERRLGLRPGAVARRYRDLATDRVFVGIALIGGFMVSGVFAMMTSSSFLLQTTFGLDARGYGLVSACNAVAFVVGTQVTARVVRRVPPARPLIVALPVMAIAGFAIAPAATAGVVAMTCATFVFMVGAGSLAPCLQVIGIGRNGHQAGTAAALLGATNYGMAGLASPIVGAIGVRSAVPMALMMGGAQLVSLGLLWWLVRPLTLRMAQEDRLE